MHERLLSFNFMSTIGRACLPTLYDLAEASRFFFFFFYLEIITMKILLLLFIFFIFIF
uniref:Uncharacterized protein n=1 Tax=Rhizophora mucronata TaxID=61149 RepID=A0A2P2N2U4_RHIMU